MSGMVGAVTRERYEQLVAEGRDLVEQQTRCQFRIGDIALEVEPMRPYGGAHAEQSEESLGVSQSLKLFAEDVGLAFNTVRTQRWVASRWPARHRRAGVCFTVHRTLASIPEEAERFAVIGRPPLDERTGQRRWTPDAANRYVGHKTATPVTAAEKVAAIHDLAADETVAATVATDFLRRPEVAARAMTDPTARHLVNRAQITHARQGADVVRHSEPIAPMLRRVERTGVLIETVGACQAFAASVGRIIPQLAGHHLTGDERAVMGKNIGRVRAAVDWLEQAVETGQTDMDEGLARLLEGE